MKDIIKKGGDRNARGDISSYIVQDETGEYVQLYGSVVHQEVIPEAKNQDLQLYDSFFNIPVNYIFSPRLTEYSKTFEYIKQNKDKYYKKLIDDLSYIFYNLSEESGVLVNSFLKNETERKNISFQLKDENTYFKVKTMEHSESNSYYDSSYNLKKTKYGHKFISILLCTSDNKVNVYGKDKDIELFLCSFGVELDENKEAMLSLPDKFNNTENSVKTFKLNISEKYKILELLQLLTKGNYNFNGDARENGYGRFVKNDGQFPQFINDILKNYKKKDLYTSLKEYGKKRGNKRGKKKNTYKFALFLKDEYDGFLPNFAGEDRISTEEYIEQNIEQITLRLRNVNEKRFNVQNSSYVNYPPQRTVARPLQESSSISGSDSISDSISDSNPVPPLSDQLSSSMSISPHSVHNSDSMGSDNSLDFFHSVGTSDQKRLSSDKQTLENLYYELKEQLNKEFLNLDSRLYSNYLELAGSVAGGKNNNKRSNKRSIKRSNRKRTKRLKRLKRTKRNKKSKRMKR